MDLQLAGKRALITGSSQGIGVGIAKILAQEGATVVIHGRDEFRAQAVAAEIQRAGGTATVALGDLSTAEGCEQVVDAVNGSLGGIDILVNNAGGKTAEGNPPWLDVAWSDWIGTYERNIGAAVRLIQHFTPGMKERKWGRIIQIASVAATQPESAFGEYQAAKAAMVNMTVGLARTLAHSGITVNTISPGAILTPTVRRWLTAVAEQRNWGDDWSTVMRRFTSEYLCLSVDHVGVPEDIGRVVALLASPLSGYMTGANYRVDGGQIRSVN